MGLIRFASTVAPERTVIDISEDDDLSLPIDITGAAFGGLLIPSTVNGTSIGFVVSDAEDGTYMTLTDADNAAIVITHTSATASAHPLPAELFAFKFFKISPGQQTTTDTQFVVTLKG